MQIICFLTIAKRMAFVGITPYKGSTYILEYAVHMSIR